MPSIYSIDKIDKTEKQQIKNYNNRNTNIETQHKKTREMHVKNTMITGNVFNECSKKCVNEINGENNFPDTRNDYKHNCMVKKGQCIVNPILESRWKNEGYPKNIVSGWFYAPFDNPYLYWFRVPKSFKKEDPLAEQKNRCNKSKSNDAQNQCARDANCKWEVTTSQQGNTHEIYDYGLLTQTQLGSTPGSVLNLNSGCKNTCDNGTCVSTDQPSSVKDVKPPTALAALYSSLLHMIPSSFSSDRKKKDVQQACDIGCTTLPDYRGNKQDKSFNINGVGYPMRTDNTNRLSDLSEVAGKNPVGNSCDNDKSCVWGTKCQNKICKIKKIPHSGYNGSEDDNDLYLDRLSTNLKPVKIGHKQYVREGTIETNKIYYIENYSYKDSDEYERDTGKPLQNASAINLLQTKKMYSGFIEKPDGTCIMQVNKNMIGKKPSWKGQMPADVKNNMKNLVGSLFKEGFDNPLSAIAKAGANSSKIIGKQQNNDPSIKFPSLNETLASTDAKLQSLRNESLNAAKSVQEKIQKVQQSMVGADSKAKDRALQTLRKLEEFQNERMNIMNKIVQSDSYAAAAQDNQLKKKSNDLMYYVWLTLAIAILFVAIRKIK
jgi:hypothetical protein